MGYRRFQDAEGNSWEVVVRGREWRFEPVDGNPAPSRTVGEPGYEKDPFEMSIEELKRLLAGAKAPTTRPKASPFKD